MSKRMPNPIVLLPLLLLLNGCASLLSSVTSGIANDLADTILNSEDVETVKEGVPAYLLMIDSFLRSSPDNTNLLIAASSLNGAYSVFTSGTRSELLTDKSLNYARHAACITHRRLCQFEQLQFEAYKGVVDTLDKGDVEIAFSLASAWAGWIQAHSSDWNAIAQLAKVKYLMEKVLRLDESYANGGPHLYMGGLETILPASMGGAPEKGKVHFEKAIALSGGKYLMVKVVYAEQYAKLIFNKELHDRLLNEVISAEPVVEGLTLTNVMAQQRAKELLLESDDYF